MTQIDWTLTRECELADYTRGDLLGCGGQAAVYKYLPSQSNNVVAVKVMPLCDTSAQQRVWMNREIIQGLANDHPRLLRLLAFFKYDDGFALLMPYYPLGNLATVHANTRFDMVQRKDAIRQLLQGLRWLHVQGHKHRDVKPWNVLVQELSPLSLVLTDFGHVSFSHAISFTGTPGFRAPEIFPGRQDGSETEQKPAVDIYSLGMTLIWLLSPQIYAHGIPRKPPWTEDKHDELVGSLLEAAIRLTNNADKRDALAAACEMTQWDPDDRPSTDECLQLPWLLATPIRKSPRHNGQVKNYKLSAPYNSKGGIQKSRVQKGKAKNDPFMAAQNLLAPAHAQAPFGDVVATNGNNPIKDEDVKQAKKYPLAMELCT